MDKLLELQERTRKWAKGERVLFPVYGLEPTKKRSPIWIRKTQLFNRVCFRCKFPFQCISNRRKACYECRREAIRIKGRELYAIWKQNPEWMERKRQRVLASALKNPRKKPKRINYPHSKPREIYQSPENVL